MSSQKLDVFLLWLKDNGAEFEDILFKKYPNDERGVHSKEHIEKNSLVIKIPKHLIIHSDLPSKYGKLMDKYNIQTPKPQLDKLVLFMLEDMTKENSKFQPYYDILPDDLSHLPIFWSDDEITTLENSHFINIIIKRRDLLRSNYNELSSLPDFSKKYSFNDYCVIRSIVGSRNFSLIIDGNSVSAMVPLGDMFNHDIPADVKWTFEQALDSYTMRANHNIRKGQAITDSYGTKSNIDYLLYYGFTISDNKINPKTLIDLTYNKKQDTHSDKRLSLITDNQKYYIESEWSSSEMQRLLSQLRIISADLNELKYIIEHYPNVSTIPPISRKNEKETLELLFEILENEKHNYGTTIDESKKLLSSTKNKNKKSALQIIIREKENIKSIQTKLNELLKYFLFKDTQVSTDPALKSYFEIIKKL